MVLPLRSLASAAVVVIAAAALLPGPAHAQSKSNQGTPMSLTPATGSEAFGCETRWQAGFAPPFSYERQPTGLTTCTAYQPGTTVDNTHLVPLKLKKGKVSFRLACTSATSCKGKARLRTRAKKPKTLATKSLTIPGGKTKTIAFKLSSKARRTVRRKKTTKVTLAIDLGAGGSATKNLKLKR